MDVVWIVLGALLILAGIIGSILPFLPGPPLCFIGLFLQQLKSEAPFLANFLWVWAGITVATILIDYFIPIYGTKRFGGTSYGVWGCAIGLLAGFWLGPLGIILGPFIGALIGELIGNADSDKALRAAFGSFIGFLAGTVLKLIACGFMAYYFIRSLSESNIAYHF